ncbi:hypothetical protein BH11ARM2_BH11ARM2_03130 [soil metagenome]
MDALTRVTKCRTILLVEDTTDDERLILRSLSRVGIPTLTKIARDGIHALDILQMEYLPEERTCTRPDLVVCDMKMPRLGGDGLLRHVRCDSMYRTVPFVMFSSSGEVRDQTLCRELGCDGYVVKPVDYRLFTQAVQGIVEHYLLGVHDSPRPQESLIWS